MDVATEINNVVWLLYALVFWVTFQAVALVFFCFGFFRLRAKVKSLDELAGDLTVRNDELGICVARLNEASLLSKDELDSKLRGVELSSKNLEELSAQVVKLESGRCDDAAGDFDSACEADGDGLEESCRSVNPLVFCSDVPDLGSLPEGKAPLSPSELLAKLDADIESRLNPDGGSEGSQS